MNIEIVIKRRKNSIMITLIRVFDHNNDGSISKEELRDAMVNFGTRCTEE